MPSQGRAEVSGSRPRPAVLMWHLILLSMCAVGWGRSATLMGYPIWIPQSQRCAEWGPLLSDGDWGGRVAMSDLWGERGTNPPRH